MLVLRLASTKIPEKNKNFHFQLRETNILSVHTKPNANTNLQMNWSLELTEPNLLWYACAVLYVAVEYVAVEYVARIEFVF